MSKYYRVVFEAYDIKPSGDVKNDIGFASVLMGWKGNDPALKGGVYK
jgi:hypothetical protein